MREAGYGALSRTSPDRLGRAMSNILRETFQITRWARWDDESHAAVETFRELFSVAPNILLANETTLARIDMAAAKANVSNADGELAQEGEYTPLACFRGSDYELEFLIDEVLPTCRFSLIYDADPGGDDGEPVPDEDTDDAAPRVRLVG